MTRNVQLVAVVLVLEHLFSASGVLSTEANKATGGRRKCTLQQQAAVHSCADNATLGVQKLSIGLLATASREATFYLGAFSYAIDVANAADLAEHCVRLEGTLLDTGGDTMKALRLMSDTMQCMHAYVGPDISCFFEAKLASAINIPMIGFNCGDHRLSNKTQFPAFARADADTAKATKSIIAFMKHNGWSKFTLVTVDTEYWINIAMSLETLSELAGFRILAKKTLLADVAKSPHKMLGSNATIQSIIDETKLHTRIYVILGPHIVVGAFARIFHRDGLNNGHYAMIALEDTTRPAKQFGTACQQKPAMTLSESTVPTNNAYITLTVSYYSGPSMQMNFSVDTVASLRNLFVIAVNRNTLSRQVEEKLRDKVIYRPALSNLTRDLLNKTSFNQLSPIALNLYDAVMLYAKTVKRMLKAGENVLDGAAVVSRMRNLTLTSVRGYEQLIDANGDAEGNFTVLTLKKLSEPFGLQSSCENALQSVGDFVQLGDGMRYVPTQKVDWPLGEPPRDEPPCGFTGEKCQAAQYELIASIVCAVLASTMIIAAVFLVRHYRYTQKLDRLLWKIDLDEIVFMKNLIKQCRNAAHISDATAFLASQRTARDNSVILREDFDERRPRAESTNSAFSHDTAVQFELQSREQLERCRSLTERFHDAASLNTNTEWLDLDHSQTINRETLTELVKANSRLRRGSFGDAPIAIQLGIFKGVVVAVKRIERKRHLELNRALKGQLQMLKEMVHENVNKFIGVALEQQSSAQLTLFFVSQFCSRGSLHDLLRKDELQLDDLLVSSLVFDLIKGMIYLHESAMGAHGNLKSTKCLINSRWVLQISGFGPPSIMQDNCVELASSASKSPITARQNGRLLANAQTAEPDESEFSKLLWSAPEKFSVSSCNARYISDVGALQKCDVYSFGIILFEIIGRNGPWGRTELTPKDIIEQMLEAAGSRKAPKPDLNEIREIGDDCVLQCIEHCWSYDAEARPDFKTIRIRLKPMMRGLKPNILDNMMLIAEKYAQHLEYVVDERTVELADQKRKLEDLLLRMLPKSVSEQILRGSRVTPEHYDCVTIYYSDIVSYTDLCSTITSMQVVDLLNDVYTLFDSIITSYDVYKVETIGDAYMVVSGLPLRNGDNHAGEIASMSLEVLQRIGGMHLTILQNRKIQIRIGLHSGPVVAGVVGQKMPRYCLFGDTVNTASRMESSGYANKVHVSEQTNMLLKLLGGYETTRRSEPVNVRGKGPMQTYFLVGEDLEERLKRVSKSCLNNSNSTENVKCTWHDHNCEPGPSPVSPIRPTVSFPSSEFTAKTRPDNVTMRKGQPALDLRDILIRRISTESARTATTPLYVTSASSFLGNDSVGQFPNVAHLGIHGNVDFTAHPAETRCL